MPDPLAIYAAAVGTGSLGWQVYRESRRLKTNVRVEFEHAAQRRPVYVVGLGDTDPRPYPVEYELTLIVVNDGETTEYVRDVYIEDASRETGYHFEHPQGDRELAPRSRIFARAFADDLELDLTGGFVGVARLASGQEVVSPVEHLEPGILEHVEEWNRGARP